MCPLGEDQGQWTVVTRRLARSSPYRPLPGRALTESRQPLHVAPRWTGIRLVLLRQCVRLRSLLLRHAQSPSGRVDHGVARRSKLLGCGPQEEGAIIRRLGGALFDASVTCTGRLVEGVNAGVSLIRGGATPIRDEPCTP
jgi:hypothetical protein